ncbi:MAG: SDR family oxidoreductase [Ferruginibacter sp.]
MSKTILITGCSSGIGRMTAKYFQDKGWNIVATVRKFSDDDAELTALGNVLVTELDVTKEDTIKTTIEQAVAKFGQIDVLLNNAGYGSYGILESTPEHKIRMQFEVNVIGLLLVTKNIIPVMRKQGSGMIINISSMGGKISFPLGTLYHGSKFAVEGLSEGLSYELSEIGIQVKMIEPGVINTNFSTSSFDLNIDPSITEYNDFTNKVLKSFHTISGGSEPILVAETIYKAATDGTDQLRYIAGPDAEQIIAARKQMNDPEYLALMRSRFGL